MNEIVIETAIGDSRFYERGKEESNEVVKCGEERKMNVKVRGIRLEDVATWEV